MKGQEDFFGVAGYTEIHIKQNAVFDILPEVLLKGQIWLDQKLFAREDLVGRNFYGNRQNVQAFSPRRRHAIEHSVCEVYGLSDGNIREAVQGFNAGLR